MFKFLHYICAVTRPPIPEHASDDIVANVNMPPTRLSKYRWSNPEGYEEFIGHKIDPNKAYTLFILLDILGPVSI